MSHLSTLGRTAGRLMLQAPQVASRPYSDLVSRRNRETYRESIAMGRETLAAHHQLQERATRSGIDLSRPSSHREVQQLRRTADALPFLIQHAFVTAITSQWIDQTENLQDRDTMAAWAHDVTQSTRRTFTGTELPPTHWRVAFALMVPGLSGLNSSQMGGLAHMVDMRDAFRGVQEQEGRPVNAEDYSLSWEAIPAATDAHWLLAQSQNLGGNFFLRSVAVDRFLNGGDIALIRSARNQAYVRGNSAENGQRLRDLERIARGEPVVTTMVRSDGDLDHVPRQVSPSLLDSIKAFGEKREKGKATVREIAREVNQEMTEGITPASSSGGGAAAPSEGDKDSA